MEDPRSARNRQPAWAEAGPMYIVHIFGMDFSFIVMSPIPSWGVLVAPSGVPSLTRPIRPDAPDVRLVELPFLGLSWGLGPTSLEVLAMSPKAPPKSASAERSGGGGNDDDIATHAHLQASFAASDASFGRCAICSGG